MEMIKVKMINSVGGVRADILSSATTLGEIITNAEYSTILSGSTFAVDGNIVTPADYHKTLADLGCSANRDVYISAIKAANGAYK